MPLLIASWQPHAYCRWLFTAAAAAILAVGPARAVRADPPGFPGSQPAPSRSAEEWARRQAAALRKFVGDHEDDKRFAEHEGRERACRIDPSKRVATLTFNADGTLHCNLPELVRGYRLEVFILTVKDMYSVGHHYRVTVEPGAPVRTISRSSDVNATLEVLAGLHAEITEPDWWRASATFGPFAFEVGTMTITLDEVGLSHDTEIRFARAPDSAPALPAPRPASGAHPGDDRPSSIAGGGSATTGSAAPPASVPAMNFDDIARLRVAALKKFVRDKDGDPKFDQFEAAEHACRVDPDRQIVTLTFNADGTLHCNLLELADGYRLEILILTPKLLYSSGNHYHVRIAPGAPLKPAANNDTLDDVKAALKVLVGLDPDYLESDWWRAPRLYGPYHFDVGTITVTLDEAGVHHETQIQIGQPWFIRPEIDRYLAWAAGTILALVVILSALLPPARRGVYHLVLRTVLAVSLAGLAAVVPGFLGVSLGGSTGYVRAAGALAVFLVAHATDLVRFLPRRRTRHVILFLAANPSGTSTLELDEECSSIEDEIRQATNRDDFDFLSKWTVTVDGMMRHLNTIKPTVVHFSGHGSRTAETAARAPMLPSQAELRDVEITGPEHGIELHDEKNPSQHVSAEALADMIHSAAPSAQLVVLNACFTGAMAQALLATGIDCVIGMTGEIPDDAARSFAVAFYRALANRRSVGNAMEQATAVLRAKYVAAQDLPVCMTREGLAPDKMVLQSLPG